MIDFNTDLYYQALIEKMNNLDVLNKNENNGISQELDKLYKDNKQLITDMETVYM